MPKTLVIVESPAKAKTISRYLGPGYQIAASVGHVRDLPSATLGVEVKNNFRPRYINMKGKEKVIKELKQKAESCDHTLIATDPDREGEAIAWHLSTILGIDPTTPCRITFNEITRKAVQEAVQHPRAVDLDLVHAQQARRILDRLVGYELSPLLWKKIKKGLSAGRVQSVAIRMIVEREEEIERFIPEEYWNILADLKTQHGESFQAHFYGTQNGAKLQKVKITCEEEARVIEKDCLENPFKVKSVTQKSKKRNPNAPFTTSTLQQEASRRLGFTSKRTMSVAQQLYEGVELEGEGATALVTYIRTDSVRSSVEAVQEIRGLIRKQFGEDYLPNSPRMFKNKNAAQDAHEAIRPAHFELPPESIKEQLTTDQFKLYRLIWERFLASQMASAVVAATSVDIEAGKHIFRATGEVIQFPGFLRSYRDIEGEEKETKKLPEMQEAENLEREKITAEQKFTQPPARYNEASLIKAMEEEGIGRPSTYAPTLSTILERKYVEKENKALVPTQLGRVVTELLRNHFNNFINVKFTAHMEEDLDQVEGGETDWVSVLQSFYPGFHDQITKAASEVEKLEIPVEETGEICPNCGGKLVIKEGRYGKFIACSSFPECTFTKNLEEKIQAHCPLCGGSLQSRRSRKGAKFYVCAKDNGNPDCSFISWDLPIDGSKCETCGSYMVLHRFRNRQYRCCGNPDCPTRQVKRTTKKVKEQKEQEEK